jgi:hypothetical protein
MRFRFCLLSVFVLAAPARADDARTIVEKAIQAHGGAERLSRVQADRSKVRGSLYINSKAVPFSGEILVQLPTRFKSVFKIDLENRSMTLVQILNGADAWVSIDSQPKKADPVPHAEMRENLALARAMRLVPLLTDSSYELTSLGESKVGDRPVLGVRVAVKGRRDLRLYFDKEAGLVVKSEQTLDDGNGKEITQENYYSDYRDLGGFKRPIRIAAFRKGAKVMEAELLEVKYAERFEDAEFAKP